RTARRTGARGRPISPSDRGWPWGHWSSFWWRRGWPILSPGARCSFSSAGGNWGSTVKFRIARIPVLLSFLSIPIAWLPLQPSFSRLVGALRKVAPLGSPGFELLRQFRALLPVYFALNLLLLTVISYLVLYLMLGRPLRRTEAAIEQLGRMELQMPWETQ